MGDAWRVEARTAHQAVSAVRKGRPMTTDKFRALVVERSKHEQQ